MDQNQSNKNVSSAVVESGNERNSSEGFGKIPNGSEPFRKLPNDAEGFRSVPKAAERSENHTLTVREAARMFETAGVARTERSIVNWCQLNAQGIARLDAYFDPNERKYFITPQSVESAIAEEKAKAAKNNEPAEPFGKVPNPAERAERPPQKPSESREIKELEHEIRDLQITNKAKDIVIEQMQKERKGFFDQLLAANRKVGELEIRLQLEGPKQPDEQAE
jgi:hypothetical protein